MFQKIIGQTPEVYIFENDYYGSIEYRGETIGHVQQGNQAFELNYVISIFNQEHRTQILPITRFASFLPDEINRLIKNLLREFFRNRFGIKLLMYEGENWL
jgi:hypothetical protein